MLNHCWPGPSIRLLQGTMLWAAGLQAVACAADGPAPPETQQDRWLLRVMVLDVVPVGLHSELPALGGKVDMPRRQVPGLDISHFFSEHWAIEVQGGRFARDYAIRNSAYGDFAVGSVESDALSLTVQYHFRPAARLKPYLGLGVNHAWTHAVRPAQGIPAFSVRDITSVLVDLGADYRLTARWSFSTSLRYVASPAYRFEAQGFEATVEVDTLVVGAGLGWRF